MMLRHIYNWNFIFFFNSFFILLFSGSRLLPRAAALPRTVSILTATAPGPVMVAALDLATALFRSRY
jgi:hypothetical protein